MEQNKTKTKIEGTLVGEECVSEGSIESGAKWPLGRAGDAAQLQRLQSKVEHLTYVIGKYASELDEMTAMRNQLIKELNEARAMGRREHDEVNKLHLSLHKVKEDLASANNSIAEFKTALQACRKQNGGTASAIIIKPKADRFQDSQNPQDPKDHPDAE